MLGCKYLVKIICNLTNEELIDTCWDVNFKIKEASGSDAPELIDTCWDVNDYRC